MLATSVLCVLALVLQSAHSLVLNDVCYWNNYCRYNYHASKTFYDASRGDIRDSHLEELDGCTPIALWSLGRHGSRRAGVSATVAMRSVSSLQQQILEAHDVGRSRLCTVDVENLRRWSWDSKLDDIASDLTESGYKELSDIGGRLKEKYPNLFAQYEEDQFYFRPTQEQRTIMSAKGFVAGIFGENSSAVIDSAWDRDDIIRPYQNCQRWQNYKDGTERLAQLNKYIETDEFKKALEAIQHRTGIDYQLTSDNVTAMFDLCRFEKSWDPSVISPWCTVFSDQDLIVQEYLDDIRHYYRNGYGSELNPQLGATALKDLYQRLEAAKSGNGPRVVAYFTHDTMMEMVYSAMGLYYDDKPLVAEERIPDRKWRTSWMGNFAANLVVTLYSCADDAVKVAFHMNEEPLAACAGAAVCSWEQFQDQYQRFLATDIYFCDHR